MNQEKDDKLQQAINEVSQQTPDLKPLGDQPNPVDSGQADPIVPQRNMTDMAEDKNDAVAAAMASVLPNPASPIMPPSASTVPTPPVATASPEMTQVKEQALRELAPLLANMSIDAEQKFKLYRDMIETLHDNSVAMAALEAAKQIQEESKRAEALLYLVNLIDEQGIK